MVLSVRIPASAWRETTNALAGSGSCAAKKVEAAQEPELANAFVVSLHALAGIHTDNTMLLPVVI